MKAGLLLMPILCLAALPRSAEAINCDALPGPVVYMQIGDTQQPLIKDLARHLRDSATLPITIVYQTAGSCTNTDAFYNQTPLSTNALYVPSTAEDAAWTISDPPLQCDIITPVQLDIANSNVFVEACNLGNAPAEVELVRAPVQAYVLSVPEQSTQQAITAQEAYFAFGFGNGGMASPWNDETQMYIRTITKSTLLAWAAAISVPAAKWKGIRLDKSTEVVSGLVNSPQPEKAIGILGAEVYDQNRDTLNVLAFRAFGQRYAYYPDSSPTSFDKRNLRNGQYTVWSPTIYMYRKDAGNNPVNANAKTVIDLILGFDTTPAADFNSLEVVIDKGLVPDCAMKVQRSYEGGPLSLYEAPEPCGCFFESVVDQTSCDTCTTSAECNGGECRHGYCEAR